MNRARRSDGQRGYVLAFLVVVAGGLIGFAGLTDDGGRGLSARLRAMDEAQAAARAASQRVDVTALHTTGALVLDHDAAVRAGEDYLAATGDTGTVVVTGDEVHVTVTVSVPMHILRIMGISELTVSGSGDARADERAAPGAAP